MNSFPVARPHDVDDRTTRNDFTEVVQTRKSLEQIDKAD